MKVAGKNVIIFIKVGSDWELYACATSATLNVNTDMIETSVSGQGKFATFLPTKNSFTGTLEGVTSLEESGKLSLPDLRQRQLAQELLVLRFQRSDGTNLYTEEGSFYITSSSDVGSFDAMNIFTIQLQGTGPLSQVITGTSPVPFTYTYGYTNINAVVVPGYRQIFPSESDFINSVDGGTQQSGTGNNTGDDVKVTFTSVGDKVRYLKMPASEPLFTKWSEEGNPLQQNQPIDDEFNNYSGDVWFRSVKDGDPIYMTYSQTTFTGAIIFSR